jgi:predicted nucleic acid-binding protein
VIVLLDTNVVLDALLARSPFEMDAAKLFAAAETGKVDGFLCATTITTIHYIARKAAGKAKAIEHIDDLLAIFQITSVTSAVIKSALAIEFADFEDAVLHEAGAAIGAQAIVTRNATDFAKATIPVYKPPQIISHLHL